MKKVIVLLISLVLVTACKKEDPCENWPITDFAGTTLFITLVNAEGTNLIENGTYPESDIRMSIDGMEYGLDPISEITDQSDVTQKVIGVLPLSKKGNQIVLLTLSDTITDTIVINLTELEQKDACFTYVYYKFNSVLYNGEAQVLSSENYPRITVVKE